jgi:S1-C subfamily serine protease
MRRYLIITTLVVFLLGFVLGGGVVLFGITFPRQNASAAEVVPTAAPTPQLPSDAAFAELDAMDQVMTTLYQRISPSVVHITSTSQSVDFFYGVVPSEGTGSGFVLDTAGHIVTNNHVIQNADQIEVLLASGVSLPAQIVGADSYYDLAVLHVDVPPDALTPLELGDSTQLQVGQRVIAIGNPFGLDRTLTSGLISALGRQIETDAGTVIGQAIQTDAAINPGNSGGPLLDTRGRVVGINTAINSPSGGSVGIGFAVPVDIIKHVVPSLIQNGSYPHPTLGITAVELGTEVNPPNGGPQHGLLIAQLDAGGPAEKAGLRAAQIRRQRGGYLFSGGDIIIAVGDKSVSTRNDLQVVLEENYRPGDTLNVTIVRDGKQMTISVTLGQQAVSS